jgi:hypothetical protein
MYENKTLDEQEQKDNQLILYTLIEQDFASRYNVTISFQAYPGGYENGAILIILHTHQRGGVARYLLSQPTPNSPEFQLSENDTVFIEVENNGYAYAGGMWQPSVASDTGLFFLQDICITAIDLVVVKTLLSVAEIQLVDEAIKQGEAFLKKQFRSMVLCSCREIDQNAPEHIHQETSLNDDVRSLEHTWLILWSCFPVPQTMCRLSIHYDPQKRDTPFTITLAEQWVDG